MIRRLDEEGVELRDRYLEAAVAKYGEKIVVNWMNDPIKLRLINTMAHVASRKDEASVTSP